MRRSPAVHQAVVAALLALLVTAPAEAASSVITGTSTAVTIPSDRTYPSSSWGLGIVVPERATLQGGGKLLWEGVSNVTAVVTLPNITRPDGIVYAVLSVMTSDGGVLQAAVGVRPNDSDWFAYSWSILNAHSVPLSYSWLLNASQPGMAPGANVTISIFRAGGTWTLRVFNDGTNASVEKVFPQGENTSLKAGGQEVFSLESYSRSGATFLDMGNLTLNCLLLDGAEVVGGVYSYGAWDPTHNPLFAVGSSGSSPPPFIYLLEPQEGSFVWGYTASWGSGSTSFPVGEGLVLLVLAVLCASTVAIWMSRKTRQKSREERTSGRAQAPGYGSPPRPAWCGPGSDSHPASR